MEEFKWQDPKTLPREPRLSEVLAFLGDPRLNDDDYREYRRWRLVMGYWRAGRGNALPAGTLVAFDSGYHALYLKKRGSTWSRAPEWVWAAGEKDVLFYADYAEDCEPILVEKALRGMLSIGLIYPREAEAALAETARRRKAERRAAA